MVNETVCTVKQYLVFSPFLLGWFILGIVPNKLLSAIVTKYPPKNPYIEKGQKSMLRFFRVVFWMMGIFVVFALLCGMWQCDKWITGF